MSEMIPCLNPSICGVQSHRPGTAAKCMISLHSKLSRSEGATLVNVLATAENYRDYQQGFEIVNDDAPEILDHYIRNIEGQVYDRFIDKGVVEINSDEITDIQYPAGFKYAVAHVLEMDQKEDKEYLDGVHQELITVAQELVRNRILSLSNTKLTKEINNRKKFQSKVKRDDWNPGLVEGDYVAYSMGESFHYTEMDDIFNDLSPSSDGWKSYYGGSARGQILDRMTAGYVGMNDHLRQGLTSDYLDEDREFKNRLVAENADLNKSNVTSFSQVLFDKAAEEQLDSLRGLSLEELNDELTEREEHNQAMDESSGRGNGSQDLKYLQDEYARDQIHKNF